MFAALLARASTKTFVSRIRKTAKKIFVRRKIHYQGHSLAEVSLYTIYLGYFCNPKYYILFLIVLNVTLVVNTHIVIARVVQRVSYNLVFCIYIVFTLI